MSDDLEPRWRWYGRIAWAVGWRLTVVALALASLPYAMNDHLGTIHLH